VRVELLQFHGFLFFEWKNGVFPAAQATTCIPFGSDGLAGDHGEIEHPRAPGSGGTRRSDIQRIRTTLLIYTARENATIDWEDRAGDEAGRV
jgi:hypothetical protein